MLINSICLCRVFILFPLSRKSEPSRAVVWEREREKCSPPPPPQSSPPLHSPTFFAVPPNLVPRVFWLVSQRGDARTPLGHRQ